MYLKKHLFGYWQLRDYVEVFYMSEMWICTTLGGPWKAQRGLLKHHNEFRRIMFQ
jgi:hypothetical protein